MSLLTTIIDHAGPPQTAVGAYDVLGLAAISRELAFNDYRSHWEHLLGRPEDLNVELVLAAPFRITPDAPAPPDGASRAAPALPATGGSLSGVAAGALAIGAATAFRRRGAVSGD